MVGNTDENNCCNDCQNGKLVLFLFLLINFISTYIEFGKVKLLGKLPTIVFFFYPIRYGLQTSHLSSNFKALNHGGFAKRYLLVGI